MAMLKSESGKGERFFTRREFLRGSVDETSAAIYTALHNAISNVKQVKVENVQLVSTDMEIPLDIALLKDELSTYRADPSKCTSGEWVDARFAEDWFKTTSEWDLTKTHKYFAIAADFRLRQSAPIKISIGRKRALGLTDGS